MKITDILLFQKKVEKYFWSQIYDHAEDLEFLGWKIINESEIEILFNDFVEDLQNDDEYSKIEVQISDIEKVVL